MFDGRFSDSLSNVRMSPIVSISEEVRKRAPQFTQTTGKKFVLFQRGEIDFSTPRYVVEAAKKALDAGFTRYPKSGGEDGFKDAIISKLRDFNRVDGLTRDNVAVTYGGQEALELSFKLFAGRKGAGFAPTWSCALENFIPYADIDFVEVPLKKDFSVDMTGLEEVVRDIAFFYLNTPQNPTGKIFSEEEVRAIVGLCAKHGVFVVSDEAYERIVYDGQRHFSPLSLPYENIIGCYTFSKTYAMTGWRLGYVATRNKRVIDLVRLGDYTQTAGVVTFLQHAGKEALENRVEEEKAVTAMVSEFQKRRDALYEGLKSVEGVEVTKPRGAFYLFPSFSALIPSGLSGQERTMYAYDRLMDKGVATVYGSCFGRHFGDNLRFSFSMTTLDEIREGVQRIKEIF